MNSVRLGINAEIQTALLRAFPNEAKNEKKAFLKQLSEIAKENATLEQREEQIQKFLLCCCVDGVLYGNWPWVFATT